MREFTEINDFDSFDELSSGTGTENEISEPLPTLDDENAFLNQFFDDLGMSDNAIVELFKRYFPNIYDPNQSLGANASRIAANLREKKAQGIELTGMEKVILASAEKVLDEIDKEKRRQINLTARENAPLIFIIAAIVLYVIFK